MKISVTRGLVQLKRLEQRIDKKTSKLDSFVTYSKKSSKNVLDGTYSKEEFTNKVRAEWQSLKDLMVIRKEIKDAIVQSNSTTIVDICGEKYTVAQAIERKSAISLFETAIMRKVARGYGSVVDKVEMANNRVENDAQRLFGTSTDDKKSEVNRIEMMKMYIETNSYEIVDPLNFKELRDSLEKDASDFLSEVDQVLSESNATTMIEISKNPTEIE